MRAKELMDNEFVYLNCEDSVIEVSKVMEEIRRFTCPVVNDNKQLVGWITSFDITREFEGKRIRYTYANRNDFNKGKHPKMITIYNDGEIQAYLAHTDRYLQVEPKYDNDNIFHLDLLMV